MKNAIKHFQTNPELYDWNLSDEDIEKKYKELGEPEVIEIEAKEDKEAQKKMQEYKYKKEQLEEVAVNYSPTEHNIARAETVLLDLNKGFNSRTGFICVVCGKEVSPAEVKFCDDNPKEIKCYEHQ